MTQGQLFLGPPGFFPIPLYPAILHLHLILIWDRVIIEYSHGELHHVPSLTRPWWQFMVAGEEQGSEPPDLGTSCGGLSWSMSLFEHLLHCCGPEVG